MRIKSALLAFFASATVSMTAGAQVTASGQEPAWLPDRQYREGAGILTGNVELHPGIAADFGYDSNFMRRATDENPVGSLQLRVSPSFSVATLGPQRRSDGAAPAFNFRLDSGLTYHEFIPIRGGTQLDRDVLKSQRNVDGFAKFALDLQPGRVWSGRIYGGLTRAIRPTQQAIAGTNFNRLLPGAGGELVYTPGSGLLDWRLGYEFSGTFFEKSEFSSLSSFRNELLTRGRWRFLPRTAMIYDGRFASIVYPKTGFSKTGSHPMRSRFGATGLITPTFGVLAMAGWGASFYSTSTPSDFNSVIGQLELKWYLQPTMTTDPMKVNPLLSALSIGFLRDFDDSLIGTFLEKDQGYIKFNYLFGGSFLLNAEAAAGAVRFPTQITPDYGHPSGWTDMRVDARLFAEYRAKDWLGFTGQIDAISYISKTRLAFPNANGTDNLQFNQVAAFGGARVFW